MHLIHLCLPWGLDHWLVSKPDIQICSRVSIVNEILRSSFGLQLVTYFRLAQLPQYFFFFLFRCRLSSFTFLNFCSFYFHYIFLYFPYFHFFIILHPFIFLLSRYFILFFFPFLLLGSILIFLSFVSRYFLIFSFSITFPVRFGASKQWKLKTRLDKYFEGDPQLIFLTPRDLWLSSCQFYLITEDIFLIYIHLSQYLSSTIHRSVFALFPALLAD